MFLFWSTASWILAILKKYFEILGNFGKSSKFSKKFEKYSKNSKFSKKFELKFEKF